MTVSHQAESGRTSRTGSTGARKRGAGAAGGADGRPDPRANQRRRTREAIVEGARALLQEGKVPSVADAAEAARVSRATAYRYFPSQGALVREVVDHVLIRAHEWADRLAETDDLPDRVEQLMSQMFAAVNANPALMRGYLLLSLEQWAKLQAGEELGEEPIQRGGRREGIGVALEPFEDDLDSETQRRLAIALSLIVGAEALVVLRDIWHLDEEEAERVTVWAARNLARAALEESKTRRR